jgi:hypothetical protein
LSGHEWVGGESFYEDGAMVKSWRCTRCLRRYETDWPTEPTPETLLFPDGYGLTCEEAQVLEVQDS